MNKNKTTFDVSIAHDPDSLQPKIIEDNYIPAIKKIIRLEVNSHFASLQSLYSEMLAKTHELHDILFGLERKIQSGIKNKAVIPKFTEGQWVKVKDEPMILMVKSVEFDGEEYYYTFETSERTYKDKDLLSVKIYCQ
uniref:Uncharacterized protein n=1 Tax=viral metagenome TaxID=1070528 RepID=A0A6H1ZII0_9ZZZZ